MVGGISYGILGNDDVSYVIGREEVLTFEKTDTVQQSVQLVKFGRVFSPVHRTIPSGQEVTIWGQVRSVTPTEWTGIVGVTEELCERSGLLGYATISVGRNQKKVPVRVCNVTSSPISVYNGQNIAEFTEATVVSTQDRIDSAKVSETSFDPLTEVTLGDSLTSVEKSQLENLVSRYRKVFSYQGGALGVEHTIPLTTDSPVTCRPRRLPMQWKSEVEEEVDNLRRRGIRIIRSAFAARTGLSSTKMMGLDLRLCIEPYIQGLKIRRFPRDICWKLWSLWLAHVSSAK